VDGFAAFGRNCQQLQRSLLATKKRQVLSKCTFKVCRGGGEEEEEEELFRSSFFILEI